MIITIDQHIPFIRGIFDDVCRVQYLPSSQITRQNIRESDCLVVRTRTLCNRDLLHDTAVKMVATATAGYEHIDLDYCQRTGIKTFVARGCNASSVAQYVGAAIAAWADYNGLRLGGSTIGIVGYGFVGREVEKIANRLGMDILLNDPPLERQGLNKPFVCLDTIAEQCDIITFHTPLTAEGEFATLHLADTDFFAKCKRTPLIINAARGGVVCEKSMITAYKERQIGGFVVDCWEEEPNIRTTTLNGAFIATPHIAGYSADGKAMGAQMCVNAIADYFRIVPRQPAMELPPKVCTADRGDYLARLLLKNYDITGDSAMLKATPEKFEYFRNNYRQRRELDIV